MFSLLWIRSDMYVSRERSRQLYRAGHLYRRLMMLVELIVVTIEASFGKFQIFKVLFCDCLTLTEADGARGLDNNYTP
jgi:hypothetical protein